MPRYDVAAYVWPSYHDDPRARLFWPGGIGEWQTVLAAQPKFPGHRAPRLPLWGAVNEADPRVMEMEIDAAADHGVGVFIYDWYWYAGLPFLEGCLNDGFLQARNHRRMRFCLMWANHDATTLWDRRRSDAGERIVWPGSVSPEEFDRLGYRLIHRYFTNPAYYRMDGKPVFMIYDLDNLIRGLGGIPQARRSLDRLRDEAAQAGLPGLHLQCILRRHRDFAVTGVAGDNVGTQQAVVETLGFDGLTHYQFCHFTDMDRSYSQITADAQREWQSVEGSYSLPYFPHVSIGWDNNPRFLGFRPGIVRDNDPAAVEQALLAARDYVDGHPGQAPLVTLNSWNEWTETSCLMPDNLYGYGYLEAVRRVFAPQENKPPLTQEESQ